MLTYTTGNIFDSKMQTLVNPVNVVGVMGAGLAKQFRERYPEMFDRYVYHCNNRGLCIGNLWLYKAKDKPNVLCFPTKRDWRQPSRREWIQLGLQKFVRSYEQQGITSLAVPPLGCGFGKLNFELDVRPLLEYYLRPLPIPIEVYV